MSAEAKNLPVDDDINTTMPQPRPEVWKMPEPVFRRTSGRLPKGFVKEAENEPVPVEEPPATIASIVVEPKPKSPVLKIIVVGLALAAMIAFLIVFLTIIYFFFLREVSAPPPA